MPHEKARTPRIPGGQSVKALLHKTEQAGRGAVRRFDEQRAQSGCQREGDKTGDNHRCRNGDRELSVDFPDPDRKSVVSGTSVAVRVAQGVRRIIREKQVTTTDTVSKTQI